MHSSTLVSKGWFGENEVLWPGQRMCLEVDKVLYEGRSKLQDILVFQSKTYGKVLVLDGVIQLTERDEFAYQEMIAHLPLFAHPAPKRVCIIGGGDGGVLREVCRHKELEEIVMCEIDPMVCNISKQFFKETVAVSFDDERVTLLHEDGAKYLAQTEKRFDVIIVDSSDPVGPAETLFAESFFKTARGALNPANGILCTQGECIWLHLDLIKSVMIRCGHLYPTVNYAFTTIPTYPSGQIGFVLSSNDPNCDLSQPNREVSEDMSKTLRYYSPEAHEGAFKLPKFAEEVVSGARKQGQRVAVYHKMLSKPFAALSVAAGFGVLLGVGLHRSLGSTN